MANEFRVKNGLIVEENALINGDLRASSVSGVTISGGSIYSGYTNLSFLFASTGATYLPTQQIGFGSSSSGISGSSYFTFTPGTSNSLTLGSTLGNTLSLVSSSYGQLSSSGQLALYGAQIAIASGSYMRIGGDYNGFKPEFRIDSNGLRFCVDGFDTIGAQNVNTGITLSHGNLMVGANVLALARVDILSSTTTTAQIRLRSGSTVSSPNSGDIWNDGNFITISPGVGISISGNGVTDQVLLRVGSSIAFADRYNGFPARNGMSVAGLTIHNAPGYPYIQSSDYLNFSITNQIDITTGQGTIFQTVAGYATLRIKSGNTVSAPIHGDIWNENGTIRLNSNLGVVYLSGATGTTRMVEVNSGGTFSASKEIIGAIVDDPTAISLITTTTNWTISGVYTGTTITNTYQGQMYNDNAYFYVAMADNYFIRMARV